MTSNFRLKFNNLAPFEKTGRDVMVQGMPLDAWDEFSKTILVRYVLFHVSSTLYLDPGLGGGGERRGLGPRNDVLTTCKAVTPRGGQRKIAVLFPQ